MELASDLFHMVIMRTMRKLMMIEAMTTMMEEPGSGLVLALFPPSVTIHPPLLSTLDCLAPDTTLLLQNIHLFTP